MVQKVIRILYVENMGPTRILTCRILKKLGYAVASATDADAALAIVDQGYDFHILFTDVAMPGEMNGIALATEVKKRKPEISILFTSGSSFSDEELAELSAHQIAKPYNKEALAEKLQDILKDEGTVDAGT